MRSRDHHLKIAADKIKLAIANYDHACSAEKPGKEGKLRRSNLQFLYEQIETHRITAIVAIAHFYLKQKESSRLRNHLKHALCEIFKISNSTYTYLSIYAHAFSLMEKELQLKSVIESLPTHHMALVDKLLKDAMSAALIQSYHQEFSGSAGHAIGCEIELAPMPKAR
jgi:hypothetical protein